MNKLITVLFIFLILFLNLNCAKKPETLWVTYNTILKDAKYIDLTHAFNPTIPVWQGFGNAVFKSTRAGNTILNYVNVGEVFNYFPHGFVATAYELPNDQYGTQLDPPAHW